MDTGRSTAIAIALLSLGAFAGCGPSESQAEPALENTRSRITITDPAADVWLDKNVSEPTIYAVQPDQTTGDITTLTVEYDDSDVTVSFEMRDVPPVPDTVGNWYVVNFSTRDSTYSLTVFFEDETSDGALVMLIQGDTQALCEQHSQELDRTAGRFTVSLNRACLGDPEWVRVAARTEFGYGGDSDFTHDLIPGTGRPAWDTHVSGRIPTEFTRRVWWPGSPDSSPAGP